MIIRYTKVKTRLYYIKSFYFDNIIYLFNRHINNLVVYFRKIIIYMQVFLDVIQVIMLEYFCIDKG